MLGQWRSYGNAPSTLLDRDRDAKSFMTGKSKSKRNMAANEGQPNGEQIDPVGGTPPNRNSKRTSVPFSGGAVYIEAARGFSYTVHCFHGLHWQVAAHQILMACMQAPFLHTASCSSSH